MVTIQRLTTDTVSPAAVTSQQAIPLTILPPADSSDLVSYLVLQMKFVTVKGLQPIPLQLRERRES